jgi:hypothetical protein
MAKGRLPFNDLIAMAPQMEDAPFITRYVKSQPHFFLLFFGYLYVECAERYVRVGCSPEHIIFRTIPKHYPNP